MKVGAAPDVFLGEHQPRLARPADRFTIVRSVSHDDLDTAWPPPSR